ncbi:MAG: SPOR domain-containing protein [Syntrophales bacterium]|nr:SPOR domain-containing protein [Syntrophales bacterium]
MGENIETYPEKLSRGIPDIVRQKVESSPDRTKTIVASKESDGGFDLTFYDTLTRKGDERKGIVFEESEENKLSEKTTKEQPFFAGEVQGKKKPLPPFPAGEAEKSESPLAKEGKYKKPPLSPAAGHNGEKASQVNGKYLIQIVSYRERERADNLCKRLKALGYSPMVVTADLPGKGKWFRVVLGGFDTQKDAREAAGVVSKSIGGKNSIIRPAK